MSSSFILDFSGRYIFALMVDKNGHTIPCCHTVDGRIFRYFSGGLFLASDVYDTNAGNDLTDAMNQMLAQNRGNPFFNARDIGWMRPWDVSSGIDVESVINPLRVLSFYSFGDDSSYIADVVGAMLSFILQPLALHIRKYVEISKRVPVIVIIPDYLSRQARALFCRVIRSILPRASIHMICHAAALSMNLIGSGRCVNIHALHSDDDGLHGSRIRMDMTEENVCNMEVIGLPCIHQLGWSQMFTNHLPSYQNAENALFGLITGVPCVRGNNDLCLLSSHQEVHGLFQKELKSIARKYVADHLNYTGSDNGHQVLVSGILSMIRKGDAIISEPVKKEMPFDIIRIPGIERPAWGAAKMLHWLRQKKNRSVNIRRHNGFRVATIFDRESISVLNPVFLKLRPGEKRRFIKVLTLGAEKKIDEQKEIVILWGNHPMVAGNACVGVLPLKIRGKISSDAGRLTLEFNLQGTESGLKGSVQAKEGDHLTSPVKLDIPDNITVWTRKMVT